MLDRNGVRRSAQKLSLVGLLLLASLAARAEKPKKNLPAPIDEFVVGRHTFFDFGPPNNYYEIYVVRAAGGITSVERITLTPAADACLQPAKAEVAIGAVPGTVPQLLQNKDLCSISVKQLQHERKRNKKQLIFSGSNTTLQVRCNGDKRDLRTDLFDRDWFDGNAKTPENTMWTMKLLDQLDKATGPNVMDKPAFHTAGEDAASPLRITPAIVDELTAGDFDGLFADAPDKASQIYRDSLRPAAKPSVGIHMDHEPTSSEPIAYPPLARAAHIEGTVAIHLVVEADAHPAIRFVSGHPMLRGVVQEAVRSWKFADVEVGREIQGTMEFKLNCSGER